MAYATSADVVPFLPAGGLPNPARVATGSASGDYLESEGHGYADDTPVTLRAETGGSLPSPLVAGTTYYVKAATSSRFQLAATAGGAAINLTTDGSNFVVAGPLPFDAWIEWADERINGFFPAHVVPFDPVPTAVVDASAELAAMRGLQATVGSDVDLGSRMREIFEHLTRWAKSLPVRGVNVQTQQPVNLAITASAGATDPRGWAGDDNTRIP